MYKIKEKRGKKKYLTNETPAGNLACTGATIYNRQLDHWQNTKHTLKHTLTIATRSSRLRKTEQSCQQFIKYLARN